ncbi:MAG: hypothetical protein ABI134_26600 [Byssovorax sp.]
MKDSGDQSETEGEDLTFEEYAKALAHLGHYREEPDVILAQLAVEPAQWQRAQARWPREMTRAVLEDDGSYSARFSAAFLPVKRRLLAEKPPLESIPPLRAPTVAVATRVPPPPLAIAPVIVPSELPAAPAPLVAPPIAPPPFVAMPPMVSRADEPAGSPWGREATAPVPPGQGALESLVPLGMRHFKDLKGTSLAAEAPSGPALPFERTAGNRPPAAAIPQSSLRQALVPEGMRHFTSLTGTAMAPEAPAGPSLPFTGGLPDRPPAFNAPSPALHVPPAVRPADLPELSIEQYASLNAELELRPQQTREILSRYGMNEAQRARFDAYWQSRLASPDARRAYEQAHATYKAWLAQSARR